MQQRMITMSGLLILLLTMCACMVTGGNQPVQIRIQNETGQHVDDYWLGTQGQASFGDIDIDETTSYRGFSTDLSEYRVGSLRSENVTYASVLIPNSYTELEPGSYTFILRMGVSRPTLSVQKDD